MHAMHIIMHVASHSAMSRQHGCVEVQKLGLMDVVEDDFATVVGGLQPADAPRSLAEA